MQPIRGEREQDVVHDPWERNEQQLGQKDTTHVLSDEGAIESLRTGRRIACVCGCLKPAGGFCGKCVQPVCVDCFGFCVGCHMPLCPRHSTFAAGDNGSTVRLCRACHGSLSRKKLVRGLFRAALSPFVRFEDSDGQG